MPWIWARAIYNYITKNGGKECAPDYFAIAGMHSVDYITLAALCVFFFLKWTELCLLLWDVLLLFTKVKGKLFVVDKWAATGESLWPTGASVGLGGSFLHSKPGPLLQAPYSVTSGEMVVSVSPSVQSHSPRCGRAPTRSVLHCAEAISESHLLLKLYVFKKYFQGTSLFGLFF